MQTVIQQILADMQHITGMNALCFADKRLSVKQVKCYDKINTIRSVISDLLHEEVAETEVKIAGYEDFMASLLPTYLHVGFCGEFAYRFMWEYFAKTGQTNVSLVLLTGTHSAHINHCFVIIGSHLESKLARTGCFMPSFIEQMCSPDDVLVDPLTRLSCRITDEQAIQQFSNAYQQLPYIGKVFSYHTKNVLQELKKNQAVIQCLVDKVRGRFIGITLWHILNLYLQKIQTNTVQSIFSADGVKWVITPKDRAERSLIKSFFLQQGICNPSAMQDTANQILIHKVEEIDFDFLTYFLEDQSKTRVQRTLSFFYYPHREKQNRLEQGCDAPAGSIVDSEGKTVLQFRREL